MANLNIGEFVQDLPVLENLKVQDPWWLLLAVIPLILFLLHVFRRPALAEIHWRNDAIRHSSVVSNRRWTRNVAVVSILLTMLMLVGLAAQPVNNTVQAQEKALLIWVYDASESMTTVDVVKDDALISRLDASVMALEESLTTIPPGFYKLLVSFSNADKVQVGLPTFNSEELLAQANEIPRGEYTATDFGLERAVSACQQFFNNKDNYPCEIFLLSDGSCNPRPSCWKRAEAIAAEASDKGIVVHTISWGNPEGKGSHRPNPQDMIKIARAGQGQHLSSVQTSELAALYNNVVTGLEVQTTRQAVADPIVWAARLGVMLLGLGFALWRLDD